MFSKNVRTMVVMELILGLAAVGVREPAKEEERGGRREGDKEEEGTGRGGGGGDREGRRKEGEDVEKVH